MWGGARKQGLEYAGWRLESDFSEMKWRKQFWNFSTGGTGYIGSHTCVELLNKGYEVVVFDNLYNSKIDVVDKIEKITGKKITFYKADMLDKRVCVRFLRSINWMP